MAKFTRSKLKVEGLKEFAAELDNFSKATSGNILKRAVSAGAAMIAEHAIEKAPKDEGDLKREIKVGKAKIITPGKAAFAQAMREGGTRAEAAAAARTANRVAGGTGRSAVTQVGPTNRAGQGILQEFGTAHHAAQPFMRPTWDTYGPATLDVMKETMGEEIEKATKRAVKRAARLAAKIAAGK